MQKTGVALAVGVAIGLCFSALASRNASGTYSLPTGNPVVTGTTISSTWANNTLTDIKTEITNSLDRNGRGAMLAPLQLSGGTSSAPSLTFSAEPTTGLYRAAAGDVRLMIGGTQSARFQSTALTLPAACTIGGAATIAGGLTATQSTANTAAVTSTGNGTGSGVLATGGTGSGAIGGEFYAAGTGASTGVFGQGADTGAGVFGRGGSTSGPGGDLRGGSPNGRGANITGAGSGTGISALGGSTNGWGARLEGGGTGYGAAVYNGTTASASVRSDALYVVNGDVQMGAANANSNVAFTNRLTPTNMVKAWGYLAYGTASPTVVAGFNIASVSCSSSFLTVTFASAFSGNYAVIATPECINSGQQVYAGPVTSTTAFVKITDGSGALVNMCSSSCNVSLMALGAQ